jgi:predicted nicotinamide N-methyase
MMDVVQKPEAGFLPETPPEAVEKRARESVVIDGRTFVVMRPAESDRLLDHPAIHSAFAVDEYMPYWADLWPGARMLAKAILREKWTPGQETLEIGCGLGLPGIAALSRGLRVTFSDYDATALRFAADNARANGFTDFHLLHLDWRRPRAALRFPVIFGSDLIYEMRNVEPVVAIVKRLLLPGGTCLVTDQDRAPAPLFRETLAANGLDYAVRVIHAGEPGGRRIRGTLYRITHASRNSLSF